MVFWGDNTLRDAYALDGNQSWRIWSMHNNHDLFMEAARNLSLHASLVHQQNFSIMGPWSKREREREDFGVTTLEYLSQL
jgi:hypothetical protein